MSKWYLESGPQSAVVISTRVRIARNLADFPFTLRMSPEQRIKANETVRDALTTGNSESDTFKYIEMTDLSDTFALSLVERHLISPEFFRDREGRALLLKDDESVSIMLGEEDHIRIQVMRAGLSLPDAYALADKYDTLLDTNLKIAFHEQFGYLTQCPTNLGTGLRASVMLHLPALEQNGMLNRLAATISKIGLTIRGTYGEGTKAVGSLFQLSNQVTLGLSEENAVSNLEKVAFQIIKEELAAREALRSLALEDSVWRAVGILKYARRMEHNELLGHISMLRLGVSLGIIENISFDLLNALLTETAPATLQILSGKELDGPGRDTARAEKVRTAIEK